MVAAPSRAMWVWDSPDPAALVAWAHAHRVGTVFLHVPPRLLTSPELSWVSAVVAAVRRGGLLVTALGSDQGWLSDPAGAVAWRRAVAQTGLFDGVHVNVEPWADARWESSRPRLVAQYLTLLRALEAMPGPHPVLGLEVDLAFWLHEVPTDDGIPLDHAAMRLVDRVTLMAYRDRAEAADGILDVASPSLATAADLQLPCRLGVETMDLGPTPVGDKQTFHEEGAAALERETTRVDAVAAGFSVYAGIAVHHYEAWRALRS